MADYTPTPGTTLVRALVAFYQGLPAGHVGEIPTEIAEAAIRANAAVRVDKLDARLTQAPASAAGVRVFEDPDGPGPATDLPEMERPADSAKKAVWFEYAVSRGADPDEAEALTKADLIAEYGS